MKSAVSLTLIVCLLTRDVLELVQGGTGGHALVCRSLIQRFAVRLNPR